MQRALQLSFITFWVWGVAISLGTTSHVSIIYKIAEQDTKYPKIYPRDCLVVRLAEIIWLQNYVGGSLPLQSQYTVPLIMKTRSTLPKCRLVVRYIISWALNYTNSVLPKSGLRIHTYCLLYWLQYACHWKSQKSRRLGMAVVYRWYTIPILSPGNKTIAKQSLIQWLHLDNGGVVGY